MIHAGSESYDDIRGEAERFARGNLRDSINTDRAVAERIVDKLRNGQYTKVS